MTSVKRRPRASSTERYLTDGPVAYLDAVCFAHRYLMNRPPDPSRCPNCRERVTPFAAGCAICGTDLDLRRFDRGPTATQRAESQLAALRMGPRPFYSGVTVVLVVVVVYTILARLVV